MPQSSGGARESPAAGCPRAWSAWAQMLRAWPQPSLPPNVPALFQSGPVVRQPFCSSVPGLPVVCCCGGITQLTPSAATAATARNHAPLLHAQVGANSLLNRSFISLGSPVIEYLPCLREAIASEIVQQYSLHKLCLNIAMKRSATRYFFGFSLQFLVSFSWNTRQA